MLAASMTSRAVTRSTLSFVIVSAMAAGHPMIARMLGETEIELAPVDRAQFIARGYQRVYGQPLAAIYRSLDIGDRDHLRSLLREKLRAARAHVAEPLDGNRRPRQVHAKLGAGLLDGLCDAVAGH